MRNCGADSLDVSGWTLSGDVNFTLPPGSVILGNDALYVAANVPGFRGRAVSPRGGEALLVVGPWQGTLAPSPSVLVFNGANQLVASSGDFSYQVATTGSGDATVAITGASPLSPFWMPISFDTSGPVGCGPVIGLGADALLSLALPAGSAPFNGTTDFAGTYLFFAPPGSVPPGTSIDGRAVVLNTSTGTWTLSRILRLTF